MRCGLRLNFFSLLFRRPIVAAANLVLLCATSIVAQTPDSIVATPDTTAVALDTTIVVAEAVKPVEPVPVDLWKVGVDLALSAAKGNESFVIMTTGAQLLRREIEPFSLELDGQVRYGRSGGEDIARRAQGGIKFDFLPKGTWSPFVFGRADHDAMRNLRLRLQSGAGAKLTVLRDSTTNASISVAGLYDREQQVAQDPKILARWSWRAKAEKTLSGTVKVQHTTLYQPGWAAYHDYLLTLQTGISTRINRNVALTLAHSYERDSTPAVGTGPDDQALNVGLRFEF